MGMNPVHFLYTAGRSQLWLPMAAGLSMRGREKKKKSAARHDVIPHPAGHSCTLTGLTMPLQPPSVSRKTAVD